MNTRSTAAKFSVSIPAELASFMERYQKRHGLGSRSEVIAQGLEKLREAELARAYQEHAEAWQNDLDRDFWDSAASEDGLDTEESRW
jgi:Arc/MetJ-type ribon-helix-helix transcriptional regulator